MCIGSLRGAAADIPTLPLRVEERVRAQSWAGLMGLRKRLLGGLNSMEGRWPGIFWTGSEGCVDRHSGCPQGF